MCLGNVTPAKEQHMKMDGGTYERLRDAIISVFVSVAKSKTPEQIAALNMSDMWTLASRCGCLAWLYGTPQKLTDKHIDTALAKLRVELLSRTIKGWL
jgi:hypothetical protein